MSALADTVLVDLASEIKGIRDTAFQSYKLAKARGDIEAAQEEWARFGVYDDASIKLDRAVQTAQDLLGSEK